MPTDPIIDARELTRQFQRRSSHPGILGAIRALAGRETEIISAVSDVSFTIQPGEMVGYIGQNGAGKSTTIKMLTGIMVPSSGDATVLGVTPWKHRKRLARRIGVVFGQRTQLWWDLPLSDSLELLKHMYRVPEDRFRGNLRVAREVLDLGAFMETPVRQLSLGQRMRGDLAGAILHDPDLLVLDEPTIGLDLLAKDRIRAFLRHFNEERGVTMLLTTHDLGDIESLCDRVMVIDRGRVHFDGSATSLRHQFSDWIEITVDYHEPPREDVIDAGQSIRVSNESETRFHIQFDRGLWTSGSAVRWLTTLGEVRDVSITETSLEHIVRRMYQSTSDRSSMS